MPTVSKTSEAKIVSAARRIVERHGLQALSMQAVAQAVGVQTPSLYKHIPDRATVVRAVTRKAMATAKRALVKAATTGSAIEDVMAIAAAWRTFAHRSPHLYALLFAAEVELDTEEYASMAQPLLLRVREMVGENDALPFARLLTAFAHGFISMELSGAFHLGGNVDEAFTFGLERILRPAKTTRRV